MNKKVITDFEYRGIQYIIDEDLVVNAKVNGMYYNVHTLINYIKTLKPSDPEGFNDAKMATRVQSTLYICQTELNMYKKTFDSLLSSKKEYIDEIINKIIK